MEHLCGTAINILMFLYNHGCTLLDYNKIFFIACLGIICSADAVSEQSTFFNVICFFLASEFLAATPAPTPVIAMVPLMGMYASLQSQS